ncbi:hypothetical protein [Priestia megaterium]|uniref:hypothetical protein n=1 Tax=Priestia megaterium TaxID=1404 RepID=UPI000BF82A1B|nr:hypothetical protein [Priestia megaterium]PFW43795.1 hypothetical protein COL17_26685 [Priestia megaterium]
MLGLVPLTHKVKLKQTALDDWGVEVPNGKVTEYPCRIEYNIKEAELSIASGTENFIRGSVLFAGFVDVQDEDILEINGKDHKPRQVNPIADLGGVILHTKVLF